MLKNQRLIYKVLIILLVLGALVLPLSANAGDARRQIGRMFVPPHANRAYHLQVGQFGVTIPAGALPRGGLVVLSTVVKNDGSFVADFSPDYQFAKQVIMEFGNDAHTVYYHDGKDLEQLPLGDVDGDGDGGEALSWHFSRYSGW